MIKRLIMTAIGVLALCTGFSSCSARSSSDENIEKFIKAGFAYKDAQYGQAIKLYESVLTGGRESGALYYNLGNSYFKTGQLGRAMLNYTRARRFIPRDQDLNANAAYVASLLNLPEQEESAAFPARLVERFTELHSLDEMVLILFLLCCAAGISYLTAAYLRLPRRLLRPVFYILAVLIACYAAGTVVKIRQADGLLIMVEPSAGRFEPREDATVHFELGEGARVRQIKDSDGWRKVRRADGKVGWIPRSAAEPVMLTL